MVLDIIDTLYLVTLIFAFLTVVFGVLSINILFKNKLKELFSDKKFFIYFSLIVGYALFALGELTWYLIIQVFEETPSAGMPDFYWITGALFMLLSFAALSNSLHQAYGENRKFYPLLIASALLILGIVIYVSATISSEVSGANRFLSYFYPLSTALILIFSANPLLYFKRLDSFEVHLVYLFFANLGFLGGDLLFSYESSSLALSFLSNILYIFAYGLSAFTFFTLLMKFHHHSSERSLR